MGRQRTKAEPIGDGTDAITVTKIFSSAGENDMSNNIVHLVLARLPDAPASTKGISLFIVPKFLVNADGTLGARNAVKCGSIEHKMGIHANATCVMNYYGATGYMIGEENNGLRAMFIMMNAARPGVGVQGRGQGEAHETYRAQTGVNGLGGEWTERTPARLVDHHVRARRVLAHAVRTHDVERGGLGCEHPAVVETTGAQRTEPVGGAHTEQELLVHEHQRERPTQARQHVEQRPLEMRRLARSRRVVRGVAEC